LIDEEIIERTMYYHLAQSEAERSRADVVRAELAISEYLEGRFVSTLAALETNLAVAESRLRTSRNMLDHAQMMSESGYVSDLDVEEKEFAVAQADLAVKLMETEIEVLQRFTKKEELATLQGDLNAAKAKHEADKERAYADEQRLRRAEEELEHCVVTADRNGMVIHPSAQAWENAPEIEEGATVHKDQILLLMPDLSQMQIKVGIHESVIDRIEPGLDAKVTLPDRTLEAKVSSVAAVTRPAGWWTGNVVKYDTIIELPSVEGLKPGMTAEVEVVLARHEDVLMIPTAAVVETDQGYACWLSAANGLQRRPIELGDSSEMFVIVRSGLQEGDEVVLHPLDTVEEAQAEAAKTLERTNSHDREFYDF
jgi:multidrug efflux pump subunit AcrA (membrane-fusion protein)